MEAPQPVRVKIARSGLGKPLRRLRNSDAAPVPAESGRLDDEYVPAFWPFQHGFTRFWSHAGLGAVHGMPVASFTVSRNAAAVFLMRSAPSDSCSNPLAHSASLSEARFQSGSLEDSRSVAASDSSIASSATFSQS